jgi:hypothetical protein
MPLLKGEKTNRRMRIKGRINRSQSIGPKVTAEEETEPIQAAEADGKSISKWARDVLLRTARAQVRTADPLMTEIQAVRLILINSLEPSLRGGRMRTEQFKEVLRYVKANKRIAAAELMESHRERIAE